MKNVVSFATKKDAVKVENPISEDMEFISTFYDWAQTKGIDITSTEFKLNAATVLTVVQSLLHSRG